LTTHLSWPNRRRKDLGVCVVSVSVCVCEFDKRATFIYGVLTQVSPMAKKAP